MAKEKQTSRIISGGLYIRKPRATNCSTSRGDRRWNRKRLGYWWHETMVRFEGKRVQGVMISTYEIINGTPDC